MRLRNVTVFGGSGFVGRHFIKRLAKTGATIRVGVRNPEQAKILKPMGDVGQITPVGIDLMSDADIAALTAGAEAVVNMIGILYPTKGLSFDSVQGSAPGRIASAAKAAGAKQFLQISAIGADAASASTYARSKAAGESAVRAAFPEAVILRPSIVFGPEDNFFNRFAGMARISPILPLIGGGGTRFQPVYVGDVADAMMAALTNPGVAGKTFELGGPTVYSFKELMELLLAIIERPRLLLSVPTGLAKFQAGFMELLPMPPLTRDQVTLLQVDNVVTGGTPGLVDLGVTPTAAETILPSYLARYRKGGRTATAATTGVA